MFYKLNNSGIPKKFVPYSKKLTPGWLQPVIFLRGKDKVVITILDKTGFYGIFIPPSMKIIEFKAIETSQVEISYCMTQTKLRFSATVF